MTTTRRDGPRFLIARMSAIGDTLLTLPVACALRERYPGAFIAWVVEQGASPMVRGHEAIDELVVLPRGWFVSPAKIADARRRLRALQIHTSIDCQSITKTALACWLSGAVRRIGCRGRYGCELSPLLNNTLVEPVAPHLTDRSLELLSAVDVQHPEVCWRLPRDAASREFAAALVRRAGLESGFAVINPGASWGSKLWEMDRFAAVARHLGERHGLPTLVVWGGGREREWAVDIVAASDGHARMAPETNLVQLASLVAEGRLFISADTGPLHMAVAVGTPSIGMYGTTRVEDCGPYGKPHIGLQVEYHGGSRKERRRADNRAMRKITVEHVCEACDALLARSPQVLAA